MLHKKFSKIIYAGKSKLLADGVKKLIGINDHLLCGLYLLTVDKCQKRGVFVLQEKSAQLLGAEVAVACHLVAGQENVLVVLDKFLRLYKPCIVCVGGQGRTRTNALGNGVNDLVKSAFYHRFGANSLVFCFSDNEIQRIKHLGVERHYRFVLALKDIAKLTLGRIKGNGYFLKFGTLIGNAMYGVWGNKDERAVAHSYVTVVEAVDEISREKEMQFEKCVIVGL